MTKCEIKERINELNYEINKLVALAKLMGNLKPYENVLIKDKIHLVKKLEKELSKMEEV